MKSVLRTWWVHGLLFGVVSLFLSSVVLADVGTLVCAPLEPGKVTLCVRNQSGADKEWVLVTDVRRVLRPSPRMQGDVSGMMVSPDHLSLIILTRAPSAEHILIFSLEPILNGSIGAARYDIPFSPGTIEILGWQGGFLRVRSQLGLNSECMEDTGQMNSYLLDPVRGRFDVESDVKPLTSGSVL